MPSECLAGSYSNVHHDVNVQVEALNAKVANELYRSWRLLRRLDFEQQRCISINCAYADASEEGCALLLKFCLSFCMPIVSWAQTNHLPVYGSYVCGKGS